MSEIKIRELRKQANLTQSDLAEIMGVGISTVGMWEIESSSPRTETLPKLADTLNCTIDELFGRDTPASA